jgi:hypothetical protein
MTDHAAGDQVLILSADEAPLWAKVLFKRDEHCVDCGGAAYHCELTSGRHVDVCESTIRRPN